MSEANVTLEGVVNIAKVESLYHDFEEILKHGTPTVIDATEVSRVDTAALQLMASFIQSMEAAEVDVSWKEVAEELTAAAMLTGLDKALKLV